MTERPHGGQPDLPGNTSSYALRRIRENAKLLGLHLVFLSCVSLQVHGQDNAVVRSRPLVRRALEAYYARDYATAVARFDSALRLRPGHPTITYNLAAAACLMGDGRRALSLLHRVALMGVCFSPGQDSNFTSLRPLPAFHDIVRTFGKNMLRRGRSTLAFSLEEKGLITEGIAYHPGDRSVFVSSVRKRTIYRRDTTGHITTFVPPGAGLPGVFGLAVDAPRNTLWACVNGVPEVEGLRSGEKGAAGLVRIELSSGRVLARLAVSDTLRPHLLGDLTLTRDGTVYVTDSESPMIYRVIPGRDSLEVFLASPEFSSLQGVALSRDGTRLYAADYARGVFVCDLRSGALRLLPAPVGTTLLGIDGLYEYKGGLVAVQNDILPHRVILMRLDPAGTSIRDVAVLDANDPLFAGPTLGVIVGNELYLNAASQWGSVNAHGEVVPEDRLIPHHVVRIALR